MLIALALLLSGCGLFGGNEETTNVESTTAVSGLYAVSPLVAEPIEPASASLRPRSLLGVYVTVFLLQRPAQYSPLAVTGVEGTNTLFSGQSSIDEGEAYALLRELGGLLQVDVPDLLNRSENRENTLEQFLTQLVSVATVATRKAAELDVALENQQDLISERRDGLRDLQSRLRDALRNEQYEDAGEYQRDVSAEEAEIAVLEAEEDRIRELLRLYEDFLDIAEERVIAIRENKTALIAGITVVEVPGIERLDILEDRASARTRLNNEGPNIFGTNELDPLNLLDY